MCSKTTPTTLTSPISLTRKLLLLSSDPAKEAELKEHLECAGDVKYELKRIDTVNGIRQFDHSQLCDAVLLDMQIDRKQALDALQFLVGSKRGVAVLCLFQDYKQLREDKDAIIHLMDNYVLTESLNEGELSTKVSLAIRKCREEHRLIEQQTLFQALLENIPDAIYFKDTQSKFIKVNHAMAQTCGKGLSPEGMEGKTDFDLFTDKHARPAYEDELAIMHTGESIINKMEKEYLSNGDTRWVSTTKVPLKDKDIQIIGTMGISRNMTELKKAEDKLAYERNLSHIILDNLTDGVFVTDLNGHYISANKSYVEYLGAKPEEIIGTTLFDHLPKEIAEKHQAIDAEVIRTASGIMNRQEPRTADDGSIRHYLITKLLLIDSDKETVGLVGIVRETT
jgi:PAS domain S-box-containing protein